MGESAEQSPEECFARRERNTLIRNAVNRLPERLRIVVLLFYMEDLSTAQIAAAMHLPQGTVLSRLHRARKLLKKELEDVLNAGRPAQHYCDILAEGYRTCGFDPAVLEAALAHSLEVEHEHH